VTEVLGTRERPGLRLVSHLQHGSPGPDFTVTRSAFRYLTSNLMCSHQGRIFRSHARRYRQLAQAETTLHKRVQFRHDVTSSRACMHSVSLGISLPVMSPWQRAHICASSSNMASDHTPTHINDLCPVLRGRCHTRKNGRADRPQRQPSDPQRIEKQRG
jgi:hypothetical protein